MATTRVSDLIPRRESYLIDDVEHGMHILFALFSALASLCITLIISMGVFGSFTTTPLWGIFLGIGIWACIIGRTLRYFMVSVPEITALITVNLLKPPTKTDAFRNMMVYPTGWWFKFPWEQVKEGMYINLRIVEQQFEEDILTLERIKVRIRGSIQMYPIVESLPIHINVSELVIKRGTVDVITNFLTQLITKMKAHGVPKKTKDLQKILRDLFDDPTKIEAEIGVTFEELYAINVMLIRIADVGFTAGYEATLETQQKMRRIQEMVENLKKQGLDTEHATNAALILNGDVKKTVLEVEGNAYQALAALIANMGGSATTRPAGRP